MEGKKRNVGKWFLVGLTGATAAYFAEKAFNAPSLLVDIPHASSPSSENPPEADRNSSQKKRAGR